MAANLTMVRIATKLDDLFNEKIDISDVKTSDDDRSTFYSRAIAALSIMIQCGIDETLSGSCVTDGYHDMRYIMIVHRKSLFLCKASGEETGLAEYRRRRQALLHKESRGL